MKARTLGLILLIIGLIGGTVAYLSGLYYNDIAFYKLGLTANVIQVIGIGFILIMGRKTIPTNKVFNVWGCTDIDCERDEEYELTPDWYERNGTPVCECGNDMSYLRTEIEDNL